MTDTATKPFTAGGRRFRPGQEFTSPRCVDDRLWVIEGPIPDTYGWAGRRRNKVWAFQKDRPGIGNVFDAADIDLTTDKETNA